MSCLQRAFLFCLVTIFGASSFAQDYSDPLRGDEITVESTQDLTTSYKERRKNFGAIFSVNYERYYPSEHVSVIQNKSYEEISDGQSMPVIGAELGVKYNFALGSLAGIFGYGMGHYANEAQNLDGATVKITKLDLNFALDNLMSEPWIVPYVQGGIHQLEWEENSFTGSDNVVETLIAKPNLHYKLGVMFQLNWIENWIDPSTTQEGLRSSGLENTYLDVFYTGYSAYAEPDPVVGALGSDDGEANLSSSGLGLGLKLEF
ncbi:hypothetical protein CIK05_15920 [Bdellovibrio sp. qaytius]|nr:hypothetical protein CIK05_15920 [Bdellovibrio sp. qaytius]